jgi:uncharacterized protein YhbP (UPF0306 family)
MSLNRVLRCLDNVDVDLYYDGLEAILRDNVSCTVATVCPDGRPYVSVAYYAWTSDLELILMTSPKSTHGRNLFQDDRVAVSIYDSVQGLRDSLAGLQITGTMGQLDGLRAVRCTAQFGRRFHAELPGARGQSVGAVASLRPYLVVPTEVKLTDQRRIASKAAIAVRPSSTLVEVKTQSSSTGLGGL